MDAVDPRDPRAFATAMNALGLDVWRGLRAAGNEGNLVASPASIATALTMTYGGAGGATAEAMQSALHLAGSTEDSMIAAGAQVRAWNAPRDAFELSVANRLFGDGRYGFRSEFVDATRTHFGAELARLDFRGAPDGARQEINHWVEGQTHDRIRDLLPEGSITDETRLVLVNAVYFHGAWASRFDAARTEERPFFARGSEEVSVPTMHREGGRYGEAEGVTLLELPYRGDELSMLFVLPRERDGLDALEARLDAETVAAWAASTGPSDDVQVALPRFRIATDSLALRPVLEALGMGVAFTDAADFTAMSEPGEVPLKISDVIHKAFVEVNEEGTEAAAATAVVMVMIESVSEPRMPPVFRADHPFLFFLRDVRTGAILFAGRVVDPRG